MYIKSIKMHGFKSFADKFDLDLDPGISAIVGPNGSGKSNVVDAILWVLGEQSIKSLRGESAMSDVIFSGSKTRDELKKASVAITFDNSDHRLNTELNEVEIKRIIYKTGENEYYINNAKVRLKDITDLLIDVTSKFNIISQGNINALVENKSSERRTLFESAAGVLKYKKRKEESLRKLEGTKENLTRINLIIKELNDTLEPLEKEKEDAEKYLSIKNELENIEIALACEDITNFNSLLANLKKENEIISSQLNEKELSSAGTIERKKLQNLELDEKIQIINQKIIEISNVISDLNSQKIVALERNKFKLDKKTLDDNIIETKDHKLELEKNIALVEAELNNTKEIINKLAKEYNEQSDNNLKIKVQLTNSENELNNIVRDYLYLQNKINIEKENIENAAFMPKSVSSIISNPRLKGIHNTIANLIKINDAHLTAINTSLSASANFIVTENINNAKEAINYLKDNSLGRATFFPIDTIKSRYLGSEAEYMFKNYKGYIGIASNLVSFDEKYRNIIENQLGNVIIIDTIDNLFDIAKKSDYKYKMVSLEGEVVYPGGSVSGGNINKNFHPKNDLNKYLNELSQKEEQKAKVSSEIENLTDLYKKSSEKMTSISTSIEENRNLIQIKENYLEKLQKELENVNNTLKDFDVNIDKRINELLENISENEKNKELSQNELKTLQSHKFDLTNEIAELEKEESKKLAKYRELENKKNQNDIQIGKFEVKIDGLLTTLSEDYAMTYEHANNTYSLNIEESLARENLAKYRSQLKGLTNVNTGAIAEYNRVKKRYDFLAKQRDDLENSSQELLNVISEMDNIMTDKFKTTFDAISNEFSRIFRLMFKGGNGLLKLSDESDILNTGINILAVPPGKKLNSTAYLSGGEKALTAICLIFAILSVKPTPFIVLDEAEAALDEENVNMFGDYLNNMKQSSQFILITHKKRMMEYADVLYGITMQESGVSKLVSVKLDN